MKKDLLLLAAGRFAQAAVAVLSLRVLTHFLSPAEVGNVFLTLSIAAGFGLFLMNPVGMFINRRLHAWRDAKALLGRLFSFNFFVLAISLLAAAAAAGARTFAGVGTGMRVLPFALIVGAYVYSNTWNQVAIPTVNMLGARAPFVGLTLATVSLGLALSWLAITRLAPDAVSWLGGQAAAFLLLGLAGGAVLKGMTGEKLDGTDSLAAAADPARLRSLWAFAFPLSGATFFMWLQTQSYRLIVEREAGAAFLGYLAVGLGIASSLAAVTESLAQQAYFPDFYERLSGSAEQRRLALADLAEKTIPVYILLAAFTFSLAGPLTRVLADRSFAGAERFVMFGAAIELFRMTANILAAAAHSEMRTGILVKPYAVGGLFTCASVFAACGSASRETFVPAAMAAGGLLTLLAVKAAAGRLVALRLDGALLAKSLGLAAPFLLFRAAPSGGTLETAAVLAAAGAYAAVSTTIAAFRLGPRGRSSRSPIEDRHSGTSAPLVSIYVPTFDASRTLAATLDSLLAQTYRNIRVHVVDNASTDSTLAIADAYAAKDPRLQVHRHPVNVGAEGNFTRCLELAEGEYAAIFHSDDVYEPDMVAKAVSFLETRPEAGAVFTEAVEIDEAGTPGARRRVPAALRDAAAHGFDEVFRWILKRGNFLVCPSALVRTSIYKDEVRTWDGARYRTSADLDVWLRILRKHPIGILPEPLVRYRVSADSASYRHMLQKTGRHDLFLVLDAWLAGEAEPLIGEAERWDYRFLLLKDEINLAINRVIRGEDEAARGGLGALFEPAVLRRAAASPWRLKVLGIGLATYALSHISFGAVRDALAAVRYGKRSWAAL